MEKKRIIVIFAFVVIFLCIIMGAVIYRVSSFSIDKGKWAEYGEKRLHLVDTIPAERGNIYDCNGYLLSSTLPQYTFYLDLGRLDAIRWRGASDVLDKKEAKDATMLDAFNYYVDTLALCLSKEFGDRTPSQYKTYLQDGVKKKSGYYKLTDKKANYQQMMRLKDFPYIKIGIREQNIDGFTAYKSYLSGLISVVEVKRIKPYRSLASRTIGDIYPDRRMGGKNGLEFAYDSILKGNPGLGRYVYATINVQTENKREVNKLKTLQVTIQEAESGKDVVSTVDINMQEIAEKALRKELVEHDATMGMAAIMDVKTGEIKAISNLSRIGKGVYQEIRNEMLLALLEPGSTFKTSSMMAALEDGVVHVNDPAISGEQGVWNFRKGTKPIREHNWRRGGYESLTVPEVLYNSSNIGISKIILNGYQSDPERYLDRLYSMGATKPMHLELLGETPQVNHPRTKHKRDESTYLGAWSVTTLPWMSFGYELLLPPIYTLAYYNAIANNGVFMKPLFAKEVWKNGKTVQQFSPEVLNPAICSPGTLAIMQDMLLGVVEKGTGKPVQSDYMKIAGKTGTVQVHETSMVNTSFCGYFPADNPQYTCFVMICNIPNILAAGKTAGGVFKNIAEQVYVANMQIPVVAAKDTIHELTPHIKHGLAKDTRMVLDELNISYLNKTNNPWIKQASAVDNILLDELILSAKVVPNVMGMGAKDAVYVLESCGLKVRINGRGKVVEQSVPSGSSIQRGSTVTIRLN